MSKNEFSLRAFIDAPAYDLTEPTAATRDKRGDLLSLTRVNLFGKAWATVRTYKTAATYNAPAAIVTRLSLETRQTPAGSPWECWGRVVSFVRPSLLAHLERRQERTGTARNLGSNQLFAVLALQEWLKGIDADCTARGQDTADHLQELFTENGEVA